MKKMLRAYFSLLLLASMAMVVHAQVNLSVSLPRSTYLLYEPVEVEVEVQNVSDKPIRLSGKTGSKDSWLQFVVQSESERFIKPDVPIVVPEKTLQPSETYLAKANVMSAYQMRSTGQYKIQAVVSTDDGTSYMAPYIMINVGGGETVWRQVRSEKKYSLIRFLLDNKTYLYLRVEDTQKGIIYCTQQLGLCNLSYKVPDPLFDSKGNLHVLHPLSPIEFLHSIVNPEGVLLKAEEYDGRWNFPSMVEIAGGEIKVNGSKIEDTKKNSRERLSEVQASSAQAPKTTGGN